MLKAPAPPSTATGAGEESPQDPTRHHLPLARSARRVPARSQDRAAVSGFWDPPDTAKEGQSRIGPCSWGLRPVGTVRDALPYLSSPELRAALSLSRTRSEPAKPGAALNLRPPEAGAPCAPADLRQDKVCALGTREFPARCKRDRLWGANAQSGPVSSRHQLVAGGSERESGLLEGWRPRRAQLESGPTSGDGGAAAPCSQRSGVRDAGAARKRGTPGGPVATLLLQAPRAPAHRPVHSLRAGRPAEEGLCGRRGGAPAKESGVSGPTRL